MKELIKTIIFEQREDVTNAVRNTIPRDIKDEWLTTDEILIISGIRRCGKSILLQQIRSRMIEKDFYFNFDDERLVNFSVEDFAKLQECLIELFGLQHTYYFDEIQNIDGWETFVRRLYNGGNKIFVTGSNARMLSRELGTHLTGRYISVELFPFSFLEYLKLRKIEFSQKDFYTTSGKSILLSEFKKYLKEGGFPKYLLEQSEAYLSALYQSIVYRDILTRNKISNEKQMQELVYYLASNAAKRATYSSLGKIIGVKHPDTVKNYLDYVEQTYLIFQLMKYSPSLKTQMSSPKKIYFIDNAIINRIGFNATDNFGVQLENLVHLEMRRRGKDVFYYDGTKECDFLVRKGTQIVEAFQVTLTVSDSETRKREISGLVEAMETYSLTEGVILTMEDKETINENGKTIKILPVWEWLLTFSD